jgi:hypothetical protein
MVPDETDWKQVSGRQPSGLGVFVARLSEVEATLPQLFERQIEHRAILLTSDSATKFFI